MAMRAGIKPNHMRWAALLGLAAIVAALGCTPKLMPPPAWPSATSTLAKPDTTTTEGSLWTAEPRMGDLFMDYRARKVGDVVTVQIVEKAEALNSASTDTKRESSLDGSISSLMGLNLAKYKGFSPQAKGELKNEFKGEGTTKRSDSLVATLSAKVVEVMDRGLLRIEGYRELNINNERQYILVRGVVRTEDISMDNTVLSTAIADAQISYSGRGVLSDKQRTGWFTRVLDYVSPF